MRSSTLGRLLCLLLLGSSTIVGALPAPTAATLGGTDTPATAGGSVPPAVAKQPRKDPPLPSKDFPGITVDKIKSLCQETEQAVLQKCETFENGKHTKKLPGEDGLTDDIVAKLMQNGIEEVIQHNKKQEGGVGGSGTDFTFQFTITGLVAKKIEEGLDMKELSVALGVVEKSSEVAQAEAPQAPLTKAAKGKGRATTSGAHLAPDPTHSLSRSSAKASGASSPKPGEKVIVIAQAKSYHKRKDDSEPHERTAHFAYKSGEAKTSQLHLLEAYAAKVKRENPGVTVLPGYLVYGLLTNGIKKGISWIPLGDLLTKHDQIKSAESDITDTELEQQLSDHFIKAETTKAEQKCWLEDILHHHFAEF
ncbi:hypothetical protein FRB91_002205 [Serendipita sp. 411]|nr:hypothetical protein FRC19_011236 [Serendipita sp. 401]KAG8844954.1 hypothetical protein FRB91_002205 [Serendipita sp. 411]